MKRTIYAPAYMAAFMIAFSGPALAGEKPPNPPTAPIVNEGDDVTDMIPSEEKDAIMDTHTNDDIMALPGQMPPAPAITNNEAAPVTDKPTIPSSDYDADNANINAPIPTPKLSLGDIDCPAETTAQPDGTCLAQADFD